MFCWILCFFTVHPGVITLQNFMFCWPCILVWSHCRILCFVDCASWCDHTAEFYVFLTVHPGVIILQNFVFLTVHPGVITLQNFMFFWPCILVWSHCRMHSQQNINFCTEKQAKQTHQYKNIKTKLYKNNVAFWYNKTCRMKQLTPTT